MKKLSYLWVVVVNEDKEEDEANEATNEGEEAKEESLARPDAVCLGVVGHLPRGHANVVVLLAPVPVGKSVGKVIFCR